MVKSISYLRPFPTGPTDLLMIILWHTQRPDLCLTIGAPYAQRDYLVRLEGGNMGRNRILKNVVI